MKDKHDACPSLRMLVTDDQAGFLQIGKNGSGYVLTLLVVSQKADDRLLSYYPHLYKPSKSYTEEIICPMGRVLLYNNHISLIRSPDRMKVI